MESYYSGWKKPMTLEERKKLTSFKFTPIIPEDLSIFDDLLPLQDQQHQPSPTQQKNQSLSQNQLSQEASSIIESINQDQPVSSSRQSSNSSVFTPLKKQINKRRAIPQQIQNTARFGKFALKKQLSKNGNLMMKSQGDPVKLLNKQDHPIQRRTHSTNIKKDINEQQNIEDNQFDNDKKNLQISFSQINLFTLQQQIQEQEQREEDSRKQKEQEELKYKKQKQEQAQLKVRGTNIIEKEKQRYELGGNRRIREDQQTQREETDKIERQIEKDERAKKKVNELKREITERTQKRTIELELNLKKQLQEKKTEIKKQEGQRAEKRIQDLWKIKAGPDEQNMRLNMIIAEKNDIIEKRIRQEEVLMTRTLKHLQREEQKKEEESYRQQLKSLHKKMLINKMMERQYEDFVYVGASVLELVNECNSQELSLFLNDLRAKESQIIKIIQSKQKSVAQYESLKRQLIDNFLYHPILWLPKQAFEERMGKIRPRRSVGEIDKLWILRKQTVKKISSITQCIIGDLQFQIDKINKNKILPHSNLTYSETEEQWKLKQEQLKKNYQAKHFIQDYDINFYKTSFFRAREILQQAYNLCLQKQNNRSELFLLRQFMNGAQIQRKNDFYHRLQMLEMMNESLQQIDYLKSQLQRKNKAYNHLDQASIKIQNRDLSELINKAKQDDLEVNQIFHRKIQNYKQFVHYCNKREADAKKMYSYGRLLPQEEIRKRREINERVKRDFFENDTNFIEVLNRSKHSSARPEHNPHKETQKVPSSAPSRCKDQRKLKPDLRQVSLHEPVEEVPNQPRYKLNVVSSSQKTKAEMQEIISTLANGKNVINRQQNNRIDSQVDFGGMILKQIPDLRHLQQILRYRCVDSQALEEDLNLYLFEFRLILLQTYVAVCLQNHPHQIQERIDSFVQKDEQIIEFFQMAKVDVAQETTNYIRSFAKSFKTDLKTGANMQFGRIPTKLYQGQSLNLPVIPSVC